MVDDDEESRELSEDASFCALNRKIFKFHHNYIEIEICIALV